MALIKENSMEGVLDAVVRELEEMGFLDVLVLHDDESGFEVMAKRKGNHETN